MENLTFDQLPKAVTMLTEQVCELKRLILERSEHKAPQQLLTIQEAADFLNLAKPTVYAMVARNEVPYMKRSKRLYFSREDLLKYIKQGRKQTLEERTEAVNEELFKKKGGRK